MAYLAITTNMHDNRYMMNLCLNTKLYPIKQIYGFFEKLSPLKALEVRIFVHEICSNVWYCLNYSGELNNRSADELMKKLQTMAPFLVVLPRQVGSCELVYEDRRKDNQTQIDAFMEYMELAKCAESNLKREFSQIVHEQFEGIPDGVVPSTCTNQYWFKIFRRLSALYDIKSGHWSMYFGNFPPEPVCRKLDDSWRCLMRGFFFHRLKECAVGISLKKSIDGCAVAAYNNDFLNSEQVFALEKAMRLACLTLPLKYKPDCYSCCAVTHRNGLGLKPTIFKSLCNNSERYSSIDTNNSNGCQPEVDFGNRVWRNYWERNDLMS